MNTLLTMIKEFSCYPLTLLHFEKLTKSGYICVPMLGKVAFKKSCYTYYII